MPATMKELGIDRLSVADRLRLLEEIWDSLTPAEELPLTEETQREVDRRLAELDADPKNVLTWEQIKEFARREK